MVVKMDVENVLHISAAPLAESQCAPERGRGHGAAAEDHRGRHC